MPRFAASLGIIILAGFINISAANKDTCDLYAAVGHMTILPFEYKELANTHELRWAHNGTIIFYRQPSRVHIGKPEDISATGSLQLKNLKFSSAGTYKADVHTKNGTFVKGWTGRLCVLEKVSKPQVKYVCDSKANVVTLTCTVVRPQGLVFSWTVDEKTLASETKQILSISLTQLKGENNFTCSVANKASKEKSDSVRLTCKGSETAPQKFPCFRSKAVMAALAGMACVILLLLIVIIVLCCRYRRNKALMIVGNKGEHQMVPVNKYQHQDSICPEYETMQPTPAPSPKLPPRVYDQPGPPAGAQGQDTLQVSRPAGMEQPSPVPKPRMKTLQTQAD